MRFCFPFLMRSGRETVVAVSILLLAGDFFVFPPGDFLFSRMLFSQRRFSSGRRRPRFRHRPHFKAKRGPFNFLTPRLLEETNISLLFFESGVHRLAQRHFPLTASFLFSGSFFLPSISPYADLHVFLFFFCRNDAYSPRLGTFPSSPS